MSKSYLANMRGFTPAPTILSKQSRYGAYGALVWGVIWRHTQLKNKKCYASIETLSKKIGVSSPTFIKYRDRLIEDGYFEDTTPDRKGSPHVLLDTGKLLVKQTTEVVEVAVKDVNTSGTSVKDVNTPVKDVNTPYCKGDLDKDIKESIKDNNKDSGDVFATYEQEIGPLTKYTKDFVGEAIDNEKFSNQWIIEAMHVASKNNVRKWSYVEAILENWWRDGKSEKKPKNPNLSKRQRQLQEMT